MTNISNNTHNLLDTTTQVMIQGITGKEGQRALEWMVRTGIAVVAGVTPGKGGQLIQDIPVYNSVAEAMENHPGITLSTLYVPPKFVLGAAQEAISAGIQTLHIVGEGVPSIDTLKILELARKTGCRVVGPSSIGFARTGIGSVGSLGGGSMEEFLNPINHPSKKGVAVLSKSGGMANTIANMLTQHNIPQTYIVGIGGDRLLGTTFADLLPDLAQDDQTAAVVIIGEIGGAYEEMLALAITQTQFTKPVIAFISGLFAENLPQGVAFGHAGAIVSKTEGTRASKIKALESVGAQIAKSPTEIVSLLRNQDWYTVADRTGK